MRSPKCLPLNDPDNVWSFCPSIGASLLFASLFGITLLGHIVQSIMYRKFYCAVVIMGALWELATFVFRSLNIYDPTNQNWYQIWFILILVAPLWINAFVYMVMGRLVYNFSPRQKIWIIPAHRFGQCFVLLDIIAFLMQATGAVMASGQNMTISAVMRGIHIYMGGVGIQQLFILIFLALAIAFHRELRVSGAADNPKVWRQLYAIYTVLGLITIRIIFRLAEYSNSYTGYAPNHEVFLYVFDALPMAIALFVLNAIHPGTVMAGSESNLPSRKERKRRAKVGKLDATAGDDATYALVESKNNSAQRDFEYSGYASVV